MKKVRFSEEYIKIHRYNNYIDDTDSDDDKIKNIFKEEFENDILNIFISNNSPEDIKEFFDLKNSEKITCYDYFINNLKKTYLIKKLIFIFKNYSI